jgi:hypothetical protein
MTENDSGLISRSIRNFSEGIWDKKDDLRQVSGISGQLEPLTYPTHTILTICHLVSVMTLA